jgi:hypothetical protein
MRKAISEILVVIVLLMVGASLLGIAYVFMTGVQGQTTFAAQQTSAESLKRIGSCLKILSFDDATNDLWVRNCGRYTIDSVNVYIDGVSASSASVNGNPNDINNITVVATAGIHEVKLVSEHASASAVINVTNIGVFDFSLLLSSAAGSVIQGSSASETAITTLLSGITQPVTFSCAGLPPWATCTFAPPSVNPAIAGTSSIFTISTAAATPTGTYVITVTGTGGGKTKTATYTLTVSSPPPFDFSVSLSSASGSVNPGLSATTTATANLVSGATQPVSLLCAGVLPPGVSCAFSASPINPTASSILTISTAAATPLGTYAIVVAGTAGALTRTATYTLTVSSACARQNPSVAIAPPSKTGAAGQKLNYTVSIMNNDNAACGISSFSLASGCPAGWTCALNKSSTAIMPGSSDTAIGINVTSAATAPPATYTFSVTATNSADAAYTETGYASYVVPAPMDFSMSLSSASGSVTQGSSKTITATASLVSGATAPVTFSCSGLPAGASCAFTPASVSPTGSSALKISTTAATPAGTYSIIVAGTAGAVVRTATYTLTVYLPITFAITASPASASVNKGSVTTVTVTVTLTSGVSQPVELSCYSFTPEISCSLSATTINPTGSSTLTLTVDPAAPFGLNQIRIRGIGGGKTQTLWYDLTVVGATVIACQQPYADCNTACAAAGGICQARSCAYSGICPSGTVALWCEPPSYFTNYCDLPGPDAFCKCMV